MSRLIFVNGMHPQDQTLSSLVLIIRVVRQNLALLEHHSTLMTGRLVSQLRVPVLFVPDHKEASVRVNTSCSLTVPIVASNLQ